MRAREKTLEKIVGKTVQRVNTSRRTNNIGQQIVDIGSIDFTDGTRLVLIVDELEYDYAIVGFMAGRRRGGVN